MRERACILKACILISSGKSYYCIKRLVAHITQIHPVSRLCTSAVHSEWFMLYADATEVSPPRCNWPMGHWSDNTKVTQSKCVRIIVTNCTVHGVRRLYEIIENPRFLSRWQKIFPSPAWRQSVREQIKNELRSALTFFIDACNFTSLCHLPLGIIITPLPHVCDHDFLLDPARAQISIYPIFSLA